MRFLLDESAEYRIATFLRGEGHDVTAIAYEYPHSLSDRDVLRIAHAEGRILFTNDRDFGELIFRTHLPHAGVIYFRLPLDSTAAQKIHWLSRILTSHSQDLGRFIVVTPRGIRIS
jgi:predicted nuclease of predicted toxin-antitoxin system